MGRVVRQTLAALQALGAQIILVARPKDAPALRGEYDHPIVEARALRHTQHDAVWYPWNGMRFAPHSPAIVTIHDPFAFTFAHRNFIARRREQQPVRRALVRGDALFTDSAWTASELRKLFGIDPARIEVVPLAPDPFFHPVAVPSREPYLFFLAGGDARKNAAMLFDAYDAAFGDGGPELLVAGTLGERDERRLAELRAPHRRVAVDDAQLRACYSGALAVLIPSLAEGFGLPAVEAMACGAPVLASDATALPEACGGAALLLPPRDPDAWRDALRRIAADAALRTELTARGLERVRWLDPQGPAKALLACVERLRAAAR